MTDLIAELAEVGRKRDAYSAAEDICTADIDEAWDDLSLHAVNFFAKHHATLTRILTDYPELRAAHHDLVIRLGEVTTELEAARRDVEMWRSLIASVAASKKFGDAEGVLRDTARHRWLRARMDVRDVHRLSHIADDGDFATSQEVDDAIDAAMKESGK